MENKGWGAPIAVCIYLFMIIMLSILTLENFFGVHIVHEWNAQSIDGTEINICKICGKINKESSPKHSHTWEVKKQGDDYVAVCKDCGDIAD